MKLEFEALTAGDVECRVAMVKQNGLSLLLYKDARCDMRSLDQAVGPMNWQRKHEFKDGKLYCSVGIWDEEKETWVWKEDVGTESNTEKEKGQASDSFKRACFNWGIGRELYTAPFIWINATAASIKQNGQKFTCYDKFMVTKLEVEAGIITNLIITKERGGVVYKMNGMLPATENKKLTDKHIKQLIDLANARKISEETLKKTCMSYFKKENLPDMTKAEYDKLVGKIEEVPIKE